jgi:hydroxyacylglutathione hydrolase
MNLEDNLGDVIRKGAKAGNVSHESAAQAAGLTIAEFNAIVQTGVPNTKTNYAALAKALHLSAPKLEGIAKGWMPAPKATSAWREFRMITTEGDGMTVNCYLVWDEITREAALFDTGFSAEPIFKILDEEKLQLKHLFITHTHADHIAALEPIRARYPKVLMHMDAKSAPPQHKNRRNDCIHLGSLRITNRETCGHADDHVIYLIGNFPEDAPHVGIIGDTIFSGSLATGNISWDQLKERVQSQIFSLPAETLLCPGHGPLTTVAEEKEHNPFF